MARLAGSVLASLLLFTPAFGQLSQIESDERLIPLATIDSNSVSLGVFKKSYVDFSYRNWGQ